LADTLTPLLVAQARMRLPRALEDQASDLVQDVWVSKLPELSRWVEARDSQPDFILRRLSIAVLHAVNAAVRRYLAGRHAPPAEQGVSKVSDDTASVATRVGRSEVSRQVFSALASLEDVTRAVVVLRVVEQMPNGDVAARLGISDSAASRRYQNGVERLRELLGPEWFGE
jgi:RNA polymerase sigma factor (sigma-70 family)